MILKTPLFPGKNFVHQLSLIFDVIGSPLPKEIEHIKNSQAKKFLDSQLNKQKVQLTNLFPRASKDAIHLLENLLLFSPNDRYTASNALNSSYLCSVPIPSISRINPPLSVDCNFNFEKVNSNHMIKEMILLEISSLKKTPSVTTTTTTTAAAAAAAATTAAAISINQSNNNSNTDLPSDNKSLPNSNNNINYDMKTTRNTTEYIKQEPAIKTNSENYSNLKKNVVSSYKENDNGFK